jgi:CxxC-x17-CxxC domain-containing protein
LSFQDKSLVCKDCGESFIFTAGEQEFYEQKGFTNEPRRCSGCRATAKRSDGESRPRNGGSREMFSTICSNCGQETQVPFQPTNGRPVYCRDCFSQQPKPAYR